MFLATCIGGVSPCFFRATAQPLDLGKGQRTGSKGEVGTGEHSLRRTHHTQQVMGLGFAALMPSSLMAFSTTDFSILPSMDSSCSTANVINRESTPKKSRSPARPSLRPKPSVPSAASRRGFHLLTMLGNTFK